MVEGRNTKGGGSWNRHGGGKEEKIHTGWEKVEAVIRNQSR